MNGHLARRHLRASVTHEGAPRDDRCDDDAALAGLDGTGLEGLDGSVDRGEQLDRALVHDRAVEVELRREVPVEHGFADGGTIGDVVHRHVVVALGREQLLRDAEHLRAAVVTRHAGAPAPAFPIHCHQVMVATAGAQDAIMG